VHREDVVNGRGDLHREDVTEALREAVTHLTRVDRARFRIPVAAESIMTGTVEPDDNDGRIPADDLAGRLALGAVMTDGPWWSNLLCFDVHRRAADGTWHYHDTIKEHADGLQAGAEPDLEHMLLTYLGDEPDGEWSIEWCTADGSTIAEAVVVLTEVSPQ
jgi:hypothetical protein